MEKFVLEEYSQPKVKLCFPPINLVFNALNLCDPDKVRVVILSQDPYINLNQAMGLAFSVPRSNKVLPPSLKNIYTELKNSIPSFIPPDHGDLTKWAEQGCLLLNTTLTVEAGQSGSHFGYGWENFTSSVIEKLLELRFNSNINLMPLVFMLWGNNSKNMASVHLKKYDIVHHKDLLLVLTAAHPSPLSASKGFFGCKHFSMANEWLKSKGHELFDWNL